MSFRKFFSSCFVILLVVISVSCSLGDPVTGDAGNPDAVKILAVPEFQSSHYLWNYGLVYVNPHENEIEIVPVRQVAGHWNVLGFLEHVPCSDCLKISHWEPSGTGTLLVDVEITHPFDKPGLTGFDVRGIVMFPGSHDFPASGLNVPDSSLGDGSLVNPDGYTTLYNITTAGSVPGGLEGYIVGVMATANPPDALLNGYMRFTSPDPGNTRNVFNAGSTVTVTYEIDMPDGPFVFGYAVDACWASPMDTPVQNPIDDFGPDANCPEAWQITVATSDIGDGLTDCGGEVMLTMNVYDWQEKDEVNPVLVECPELYNGQIEATWKSDQPDFTTYEAIIGNVGNAPAGIYSALVSKEAAENNPEDKPWLDLTAYAITDLEVAESPKFPPTAVVETTGLSFYIDELVSFNASGSHDNDCDGNSISKYEWDWSNDGVYDEDGKKADHYWDAAGTYLVQLRVTDNEDQTDCLDSPIEVTVHQGGDPYSPVDVTPSWINAYPGDVFVDGDYVFTACGDKGLHIFDITDPVNPVWISGVSPLGEFDGVVISGGYAYTGFTNGDIHGIMIVDIDPPVSAFVVNTVETPLNVERLAVSGAYAYVVDSDVNLDIAHLHIIDIDQPESAELVKTVDLPGWAKSVTVSDGHAYVANGYSGLQIADIDPPESASIINSVQIPGLPASTSYGVTVSGNYAYVASDYGLKVVDIDPPESAHVVHSVCDYAFDVTVSGGYAYIPNLSHGLLIVDISEPESAYLARSIDIPGSVRRIAVSEGHAYAADTAIGLLVIDIDPVEASDIVGSVYGSSYAVCVEVWGNLAIVGDDDAGLLIYDIETPESADFITAVEMPGSPREFASSVGFTYIATSGIQVVDIDPAESAHIIGEVGYTYTPGQISISGSFAYTSHGSKLQIIDISMPAWAWVNKSIEIPGDAWGVAASGGYAYVAGGGTGLQIVDVDPYESAFIMNTVTTPNSVKQVDIAAGYAYTVNGGTELQIIDIDPPESAGLVNSITLPANAGGIEVSAGYAYVWKTYDPVVYIVDIDPPETAAVIGSIDTPCSVFRVAVAGNYAYIADGNAGPRIIKLW